MELKRNLFLEGKTSSTQFTTLIYHYKFRLRKRKTWKPTCISKPNNM